MTQPLGSIPAPRDPNSRGALLFYKVVRWFLLAFSVKPWRVRYIGTEQIPTSGAAIVAPSHRSMLDITWTCCITRRRLRYMGKASAFRIPVLGWCFSALGGFAVERDGNDRAPLRDSLAILENGEVLTIYPEGTRQRGPKIMELQPGAAWLAIKAQVPIVPVAIVGTEEIFRSGSKWPSFRRGVVLVGAPIMPPKRTSSVVKRELVNQLSDDLRAELQRLFDLAAELRN